VEGSGRGIIWGTMQEFPWFVWGELVKPQDSLSFGQDLGSSEYEAGLLTLYCDILKLVFICLSSTFTVLICTGVYHVASFDIWHEIARFTRFYGKMCCMGVIRAFLIIWCPFRSKYSWSHVPVSCCMWSVIRHKYFGVLLNQPQARFTSYISHIFLFQTLNLL
jgi:hypothetical protein